MLLGGPQRNRRSQKLRLAEFPRGARPIRHQVDTHGSSEREGEALESLRDLARGIYPPLLADKGLAAALESQARKGSVPTEVRSEGIGRSPRVWSRPSTSAPWRR